MRRAAHQILDHPLILDDPYALRILPAESLAEIREPEQSQSPFSTNLRLFMAVRSRFAEDEFAETVNRGVRQYVALGAGLDTFAWRNPYVEKGVRVFEVDHPATQRWKRELIVRRNLPEAPATAYVPVDFERESLAEALANAGFRADAPAFFSWLGVAPYLTLEAFRETLRFFGKMAVGSGVVLDYALPREAVDEISRAALDELSARVARAGEPFQLFFMPHALEKEFEAIGWSIATELDGAAIRTRYLPEHRDVRAARNGVARLVSAAAGRL